MTTHETAAAPAGSITLEEFRQSLAELRARDRELDERDRELRAELRELEAGKDRDNAPDFVPRVFS